MRWWRWKGRIDDVVDQDYPTDAHPIPGHPGRAAADPDAERRLRLKRRSVFVIPAMLLLVGSVAAVFGKNGWRDLQRLRVEAVQREAALEVQRARVAELRAAVEGLKHEALPRERIAREQLGMSLPGEINFLLPRAEEELPGTPATPDAAPDGKP